MAAVMNYGQDSFTDAVNNALAELKENGKYDEIVAKWFE
jgi:ABC-type amino acid transport substrate-binding protein